MLNFGRFEDGDTVVGDHRSPFIVDEQLVLAQRAQRGPHGACKCHSGRDVVAKGFTTSGSRRLLENGDFAHTPSTDLFPISQALEA